jgi:pyroglutamyl-peptidase
MRTAAAAEAVLLSPRAANRTAAADTAVAVEFHVTAFGPFYNTPINPTELLLRSLPSHLTRLPLPPAASLASATVLETDVLASRTVLERMHAKLVPLEPAEHPPVVVLLHFGVNASTTRFELEIQAFNEAHFSCPDQAGYAPQHCPLDPDRSLPLSHRRKTKLPVETLATALRVAGHDCGVSSSAGRYVCNAVFYTSMRLAERNGSHVLFVHVPPHQFQPLHAQLSFFSDLLSAITSLHVQS